MNLDLFWFTLLIVAGSAQRMVPFLYWRNLGTKTSGRRYPGYHDEMGRWRTPFRSRMSNVPQNTVATKFNSPIFSSARQQLANQRLSFVDPVHGGRHSVNYRPIQRSHQIGQYYNDNIGRLSKLKMFPGAALSAFEHDSVFGNNKFNSVKENSYVNDDKFFSNLQKRRQWIFGGKTGRRASFGTRNMARSHTAVRIVPKSSIWDRLIMYLLNDWESQ